jgi:YgiT-type zinc finger domain-containing protein
MYEGRHDFMARVGDEILVVKDVPALICDTCGEVEYTLETSREIDAIMKDFFAGRLLAKPLAAGEHPKGKSCQAEPSRRFILSEIIDRQKTYLLFYCS